MSSNINSGKCIADNEQESVSVVARYFILFNNSATIREYKNNLLVKYEIPWISFERIVPLSESNPPVEHVVSCSSYPHKIPISENSCVVYFYVRHNPFTPIPYYRNVPYHCDNESKDMWEETDSVDIDLNNEFYKNVVVYKRKENIVESGCSYITYYFEHKTDRSVDCISPYERSVEYGALRNSDNFSPELCMAGIISGINKLEKSCGINVDRTFQVQHYLNKYKEDI